MVQFIDIISNGENLRFQRILYAFFHLLSDEACSIFLNLFFNKDQMYFDKKIKLFGIIRCYIK